MEECQIEFVFSENGYEHLYEHLKVPIEISGILSNVDLDILESFFEAFDYSNYERLLFDEFRYYFTIFQRIHYQMV